MQVTSTVASYREVAVIEDPGERREAWVRRYEGAHADIFASYYSGWGRHDRRDAAADAAPGLLEVITRREARMVTLLGLVGERLGALGVGIEEPDAVLLVGGHTSNGWATRFKGRPTLFIALEFLTDGVGDDVLAIHEGVHAFHLQRGMADDWPETIATALFSEGLAVAVSRLALSPLAEGVYFWFDEDHDSWVAACQQNAEAIKQRACEHIDAPDGGENVAGLFRNAPVDGLPIRSGYWLGDRMIRDWLAEGASVDELLRMPPRDALARTRAWCCRVG